MQKILLASLVSAAFAMPAVAAEQADVVISAPAVQASLLLLQPMTSAKKLSFLKKWLWSAATQTVQPAV